MNKEKIIEILDYYNIKFTPKMQKAIKEICQEQINSIYAEIENVHYPTAYHIENYCHNIIDL